MKCESCTKGYNGRNGNGYQPCGCAKRTAIPLWIRFKIWRLNRHADSLIKEAEHHRNAAKMHSAASSLFWSKANDIRAAARKLIAGPL